MRNKVIILSLSLVMVLCSSFSVFASTVVNFDYSEPAKSPTQGYLCVRLANDNNYVFFWSINPRSADDDNLSGMSESAMNLSISADEIIFTPTCAGNVSFNYHITQATQSGNVYTRATGFGESTASYTYTPQEDIVEYCYYGNVGIVYEEFSAEGTWLRVNWGSNNVLSDLSDTLADIWDELVLLEFTAEDILVSLNDIKADVSLIVPDVESIRINVANIVNRLDTLNGKIDDVNAELDRIYNQLTYVNDQLDLIYYRLGLIHDELVDANAELDRIYNQLTYVNDQLDLIYYRLGLLLDMEGDEDTTELDDSDIGELGSDEDEVLDDDSELIDDLSLSFGEGFGAVFDLISQAWQTNPKVFSVVIMCLTIGVLKLILNR